MTSRATIDRFLGGHRFALVGVSSRPGDFSRMVLRELTRRGYEVVPVRPDLGEVEGVTAYARVQDVPGKLDGAILMTPPAATETVVRDCAQAGVQRVWMHRGAGAGAVSAGAVTFCREQGIEVVEGECPLMFLSGAGFVHRAHGAWRRLWGSYPR
jgi:predicted CoA-binding protein